MLLPSHRWMTGGGGEGPGRAVSIRKGQSLGFEFFKIPFIL